MDMLGDLNKGVERRPYLTSDKTALIRMPLSTPQDTKRSIVISPSRAHTRTSWYHKTFGG